MRRVGGRSGRAQSPRLGGRRSSPRPRQAQGPCSRAWWAGWAGRFLTEALTCDWHPGPLHLPATPVSRGFGTPADPRHPERHGVCPLREDVGGRPEPLPASLGCPACPFTRSNCPRDPCSLWTCPRPPAPASPGSVPSSHEGLRPGHVLGPRLLPQDKSLLGV